jgi:hypothetical protein
MHTDKGTVRISLREWYALTVGGSDHPSRLSCVDQVPGFPAERLTWAIIQLLGAARDTNRDTK